MNAARLKFSTRFGYGLPESGIFLVEIMLRLYLLKFYTDQAGLDPALAGAAAAVAMLWDGITDPLMGLISDRTRTRFGRRIPYILPGALILSAGIFAVFHPPQNAGQVALTAYLLITFLVLNTGFTLVSIPHSALAAELTSSGDERTVLFSYRLFIGNMGLLAGVILPAVITERAYEKTSEIAVVLILVSVIAFYYLIKKKIPVSFEKSAGQNGTEQKWIVSFLSSFRQVFSNRAFVPLLISYIIAYLGVSVNSTFALYYYDYRLQLSEEQTGLVLVIFILTWSLSLGGWVWLSKKFGRKMPAFYGIATLGVLTCITYPFFPAENMLWPILMAVTGGILVGAIVLLDALVADIVDYDRIFSHREQEGAFFGIWRLAMKLSRALALAVSGAVLALIGFQSAVEPTEAVIERIGYVFGPGVGIFFIAGGLIFLYVPLSREKNEKIKRILEKKEARNQREAVS